MNSIKLSPNEQKIIDFLKDHPGKHETSYVAEKTGINPKSIGRYAKQLAKKRFITREYRMKGSVRYWDLEFQTLTPIEKPKPQPKSEIKPRVSNEYYSAFSDKDIDLVKIAVKVYIQAFKPKMIKGAGSEIIIKSMEALLRRLS